MKRMSCVLLGFCLASFSLAGEKPAAGDAAAEAHAILEKADAAIKAVASVRYRSASTPTGVAVRFAPAAEGT
ncbi:unnamed protein product, partial [marine sediment metagenome]